MSPNKKNKSIPVFLLQLMVSITGFSGLYGGLKMIFDPTGESLKLSLKVIEKSWFPNYLLPGFFTLFLGLFALLVFAGLVRKFDSAILNSANLYKDQNWSWSFSVYLGVILTVFIECQLMIIGYFASFQLTYALMGVAIIVVALIPSVRNYFQIPIEKKLYKDILREYKTAIKYKDLVS